MRQWRIECTGCDFKQGDPSLPGGYRHFGRFYAYLLPDQSILSLPFIAVWCRECREVTHGEEMPTVGEIQDQLAASMSDWEQEDLRILLKWRPQRLAPPKCLYCGSSDFVPITLSFQDMESGFFPHPDCKGDLHFISNGGYTLGRQEQHLFSFEGDYLDRTVEWRS